MSGGGGRVGQRGIAVFAVLLVLALGIGIAVTAVQLRTAQLLDGTRQDRLGRQLERLADAVADYYTRTAAAMDTADAAPVDCPTLLGALASGDVRDLQEIGRLACVIGTRQRMAGGTLAWRSIWLWLPPEDAQADATLYDPDSDQLLPAAGVLWQHVDGRAIQTALLQRSFDQQERLADYLNTFYRAHAAGNAALNFWAREPCPQAPSPATRDAPACTAGAYADATAVLGGLGAPDAWLVDAWGRPFQFRNGGADLPASAPFAALLRLRAPWGFDFDMTLGAAH